MTIELWTVAFAPFLAIPVVLLVMGAATVVADVVDFIDARRAK